MQYRPIVIWSADRHSHRYSPINVRLLNCLYTGAPLPAATNLDVNNNITATAIALCIFGANTGRRKTTLQIKWCDMYCVVYTVCMEGHNVFLCFRKFPWNIYRWTVCATHSRVTHSRGSAHENKYMQSRIDQPQAEPQARQVPVLTGKPIDDKKQLLGINRK